MTNSNLVGLITGRSAGFSPLNRDRRPRYRRYTLPAAATSVRYVPSLKVARSCSHNVISEGHAEAVVALVLCEMQQRCGGACERFFRSV